MLSFATPFFYIVPVLRIQDPRSGIRDEKILVSGTRDKISRIRNTVVQYRYTINPDQSSVIFG
jgi:hypothetical protein